MRKFVLTLILIASTTFAATYQTIGGVPADNLCDAGGVFKTIKPVKVCDQWQETPTQNHGELYVPGDWRCLKYITTHLDISKEIDVCLKMEVSEAFVGCIEMGKGTQGNTVVVEEKVPGTRDNLRYYSYTIPPCP